MRLCNSVRTLRLRKKLTLIELGEMADIGKSTINDIERGLHIPGVDTALRIAAALGVDVGRVFWLSDGGTSDE